MILDIAASAAQILRQLQWHSKSQLFQVANAVMAADEQLLPACRSCSVGWQQTTTAVASAPMQGHTEGHGGVQKPRQHTSTPGVTGQGGVAASHVRQEHLESFLLS